MIIHNKTQLSETINLFKNAKVLVIGDAMLDKFLWGEVTRISPEAPVPVVHIKKETCAPGGAANAAMNVATLGAKCHLISLAGDDSAKDVLIKILQEKNINTEGVISCSHPTIQKIRVMGNNQQLTRIDYEEKNENPKEKEMITQIHKTMPKIDIILVSDYAKGTITETIMAELKKTGKKIIVDPKPDRFHYYKGAYAIKPNQKEASEITKIKETTEEKISQMGRQIQEQSGANIILSRGRDGISIFETDGTSNHIPAQANEACDVTGAGDTVVATIAVATAIGATIKEATILANYAAGIKVKKLGTVPVTSEELQNLLKEENERFNN